jgi:hypothetical protein
VGMQSPRSAALLIRIFVDATDGAGWYGRVQAVAEPETPELEPESVLSEDELVQVVRRWVKAVIGPAA